MKISNRAKGGFTLIELLIVIGILAVLAIAVLFFLNPAQLASQGRDQNRLSDITSLNQNISLYHEINPGGSLGSSSVVYVSIPDPTATTTAGTNCAGVGFPTTGSVAYHCAASSTYRNNNGTGWVPINFANTSGSPIVSTLPVDPINTTSSNEYYVYTASGTQYELIANPQAQKNLANSGSSYLQGTNVAIVPSFPTAFAPQNIWVLDYTNDVVQEFNTNGGYITQFGTSSFMSNAVLFNPYQVAFDTSGNAYVVTYPWGSLGSSNEIKKFDSNGNYVSTISVGKCTGASNGAAEGIAFDGSGNIEVANYGGFSFPSYRSCVNKISTTGTSLSQFSSNGTSTGQMQRPAGIAIDASGNIWVTDPQNYRIDEFASDGSNPQTFGTRGSGNGQFQNPDAIAIDTSGNIWVSDLTNHNVQELSATGTYITQFGSYGTGSGQFKYPTAIAIDRSGNIWVADQMNYNIQEFNTSGTVLFQFGSYGTGNGQFEGPISIVIR